ncbi:MAG: hypothetical protein PHQ43_14010 [Dehalococcoidales bacterium]|nr:hypothetical protein [Dehalococcoidales bacterium]
MAEFDVSTAVVIVTDTITHPDTVSCPHCGADGHKVIYFIGADRKRHAAMAGCFKRWPKSPLYKGNKRQLKGWERGEIEIGYMPARGWYKYDRAKGPAYWSKI